MVKISGAIVRRLRVVLPPMPEQRRILDAQTEVSAKVAAEEREAGKLRLLKQGLAEDLLTGRVRVTSLLEKAAR